LVSVQYPQVHHHPGSSLSINRATASIEVETLGAQRIPLRSRDQALASPPEQLRPFCNRFSRSSSISNVAFEQLQPVSDRCDAKPRQARQDRLKLRDAA